MGLKRCETTEAEEVLDIFLALLKYSALEKPDCYDQNTLLIFDVVLRKMKLL